MSVNGPPFTTPCKLSAYCSPCFQKFNDCLSLQILCNKLKLRESWELQSRKSSSCRRQRTKLNTSPIIILTRGFCFLTLIILRAYLKSLRGSKIPKNKRKGGIRDPPPPPGSVVLWTPDLIWVQGICGRQMRNALIPWTTMQHKSFIPSPLLMRRHTPAVVLYSLLRVLDLLQSV